MSTLNADSAQANPKSTTPQTRGFRPNKKRTHTGDDERSLAEDQDGVVQMDLTMSSTIAGVSSSPIRESSTTIASTASLPAFNPPAHPHSSSFNNSNPSDRPLFASNVPRPTVPSSSSRTVGVVGSARQPCLNLPTCIRLTPTIPPGRMEAVQTGLKVELTISNMPRSASRGLEEYVNDRASALHARDEFTVERIKLYIENNDVVLFGKIGTEYDVRALHYLFRDIAAGSHLRYCPHTFPDLATAIQNAKPWVNQGGVFYSR